MLIPTHSDVYGIYRVILYALLACAKFLTAALCLLCNTHSNGNTRDVTGQA